MKTSLIISTIFFAYLFFSSNSIMACSCVVYDVPTEFKESKAVFIGKVTDTDTGFLNSYVDFRVEKSWKSVDVDEITLDIIGCDRMNFVTGETYLVYAYADGGSFFTGSCTRTREISKAEEDLNFLKDKNLIPLKPKFFTKNVITGITTAIFVLVFIGIGFLLIKFKKGKKNNL